MKGRKEREMKQMKSIGRAQTKCIWGSQMNSIGRSVMYNFKTVIVVSKGILEWS